MSEFSRTPRIPEELAAFPGAFDSTYVTYAITRDFPELTYKPTETDPLPDAQIDEWACEVAVLANALHLQEGTDISQEELSQQIGRTDGQGAEATSASYWKFLLERGYSVVDVFQSEITNDERSQLADLSAYSTYQERIGTPDLGRNILNLLSEGYIVDLAVNSEDGNAHSVLVHGAVVRSYGDRVQTYFKVYDPTPNEFTGKTLCSRFDFQLRDRDQPNQVASGIKLA